MKFPVLTKREYLVLKHFAENRVLTPKDCQSEEEYNLRADTALELFRRGLLLSNSEKPYRENYMRANVEYLDVGLLRPLPSALWMLKVGYPAYVSLAVLTIFVTSGALVTLIGLFL